MARAVTEDMRRMEWMPDLRPDWTYEVANMAYWTDCFCWNSSMLLQSPPSPSLSQTQLQNEPNPSFSSRWRKECGETLAVRRRQSLPTDAYFFLSVVFWAYRLTDGFEAGKEEIRQIPECRR